MTLTDRLRRLIAMSGCRLAFWLVLILPDFMVFNRRWYAVGWHLLPWAGAWAHRPEEIDVWTWFSRDPWGNAL